MAPPAERWCFHGFQCARMLHFPNITLFSLLFILTLNTSLISSYSVSSEDAKSTTNRTDFIDNVKCDDFRRIWPSDTLDVLVRLCANQTTNVTTSSLSGLTKPDVKELCVNFVNLTLQLCSHPLNIPENWTAQLELNETAICDGYKTLPKINSNLTFYVNSSLLEQLRDDQFCTKMCTKNKESAVLCSMILKEIVLLNASAIEKVSPSSKSQPKQVKTDPEQVEISVNGSSLKPTTIAAAPSAHDPLASNIRNETTTTRPPTTTTDKPAVPILPTLKKVDGPLVQTTEAPKGIPSELDGGEGFLVNPADSINAPEDDDDGDDENDDDNEPPSVNRPQKENGPVAVMTNMKEGSIDSPIGNENPPNRQVSTFSISYSDDGDSHFFMLFLIVTVSCIFMYVLFHNRQKVLALMLEGRQERRRRPNTSQYRRLDSNFEEVIHYSGAPKQGPTTNVIY